MQCITRWVGRGGIGITGFYYIHVWITRPATYKKLTLYFVEKNICMFRPHLDTFIVTKTLPNKTKNGLVMTKNGKKKSLGQRLKPSAGAASWPPQRALPQVSTHVALDHQAYSALDEHTQITWTAQLTCDEHSRAECGGWVYITY